MSTLFDPILSTSQFQLPPQDIRLLSCCESNKLAKLKSWVEQLRLTQITQSSVALYRATPEVVRLITDTKTRFDMLESLWWPAQQTLSALSREYLQQPLLLPPKAEKAALLAQALQKHLLDGYCVCIRELVTQKRLKNGQREVLTQAIARALTALSMIVLRTYQLYTNVPSGLWLRAHTLFQVAEYYDLQAERLLQTAQDEAGLISIRDIYLRLVALACVRPNQLSQYDILLAYKGLSSWVKHIQTLPSATSDNSNFCLVPLNQDSAPVLKDRFEGDPNQRVIELDFKPLISQLSKLSGQGGSHSDEWGGRSSVTIPSDMSDALIAHILDCWSNSVQRHQDRSRSDIDADACVGMLDVHYQLCGSVDFQSFLNPRSDENEEFLSGGFDSLISSFSKVDKDIDKPKADKQTIFKVVVQNISAGGYCVLWRGDLPNKIDAGELISIREQGRRAWGIGVIRWIRQLKNASQLGVQLITNQPVPYGAAIMYDMGGYSDHMRAIHIPAPAIADLPPGLLTAAIPFQENCRVKLKQDGHDVDVRLTRCTLSTSKLRIFSFDTLSSKDDELS